MNRHEQDIERDGFTVRVRVHDDDVPDLSWLGEYKSKAPARGPYYDRALGRVVDASEDCMREDEQLVGERWDRQNRHTYRYIWPGTGDVAYLEQDAKRLEQYGDDWSLVGIVATAYRAGVELGQASIWGVETDSADRYFAELTAELVDEAVAEAKAKLAELTAVR